jgi:hypothetical protein
MNQQEIEVSNKADKIVHKVEKKMDAKNVACFAEMQGQVILERLRRARVIETNQGKT